MSSYYQTPIRSDELYHFGVKGMHWGVRRYQNANGSYTSAGKQRRRTESKAKSGTTEKKSRLSPGKKRAIKIGAGAVAAGLAIYGGYKLRKSIKFNTDTKNIVKRAFDNAVDERATYLVDAREGAREWKTKRKFGLDESFNTTLYPRTRLAADLENLNKNSVKTETKKLSKKAKELIKKYNYDPRKYYIYTERLKEPEYTANWVGYGRKKYVGF